MKQIKVTNIRWDAPAEAGLPTEVTINIDESNTPLLEDIDGYADKLSDYLSDTYEYCHEGFCTEVIETNEEADNTNLSKNYIRVKIPTGYLMVEIKGTETEFPGVFVSFSEDGKAPDINNLIACVEYDTVDNEIKTETYCAEHDNPVAITHYESGEVV